MSVSLMAKLKELIRQKGVGATLSTLEVYEYLGNTSGYVGMLLSQLEEEGVLESLRYPVIFKGRRVDVSPTKSIMSRIEEELRQTEAERKATLAARIAKPKYRIIKIS